MKVETPQIAWHNRDRVSTISIQPQPHPRPTKDGGTRIATGGDDTHVVIWEFLRDESGKIQPQCLCDLVRHQNSVNAIRWSPDGKILASADTDSAIFLWNYSESEAAPDIFGSEAKSDEVNEENWTVLTTLRGHLQDVIGLSWSPDSQFLVSCSTDNTAIVFDAKKGTKLKMLDDHKGWVNGVTWDPLGKFIATISSDRILRFYKTKNYKILSKVSKSQMELEENGAKNVRLFHDDTFQSFFRRLDISPDGELLVVPSGVLEIDGETSVKNCAYVFNRTNLTSPVLYLPCKEISIAVKFSPIKYNLRAVPRMDGIEAEEGKIWTKYQTLFALPYRMVFAVATKNTIAFYDTQQAEPFARVSKIHYVSLNDLAWSSDGNMLVVASTDGFCSVIKFKEGEIGTIYSAEEEDEENNESILMDEDDEEMMDEDVPLTKEGIPLNKQGTIHKPRGQQDVKAVKFGQKLFKVDQKIP